MEIGFYIVMFVLGMVLLVWGSSLFVDSAVTLADKLHLPEVFIGATVVSLGTTLPESLFSVFASVKQLPEMALGNALGSILCNTGFIAGILLFLRPIALAEKEVKNLKRGGLFLSTAYLIYIIGGITREGISRGTGLILVVVCGWYLKNMVRDSRSGQKRTVLCQEQGVRAEDIFRILLETAALYLGAKILVEFGPKIARSFGIPEVIISLTFIALGTSLPELVTSLIALRKQHSSLSLGNIIGADILNFTLVGGISAVICPVSYVESVMSLELPFIFLLLSLLCMPSVTGKRTWRIQGLLLLLGYGLYLALLLKK